MVTAMLSLVLMVLAWAPLTHRASLCAVTAVLSLVLVFPGSGRPAR